MKKRDPFLATFKEQWQRTLDRVGWTPRARLEWAVRAVQAGQAGWTPGAWEDFCRELAVFASGARGGGAESDEHGDIARPAPEAARTVLLDMDRMLTAAAERAPIVLGRRVVNTRLAWYGKESRYIPVPPIEDFNWAIETREKLGRLLEEFGHLVKQCKAPARRKNEAVCGVLFVAARPRQEFCSPRCQARAATRRFREEQKKKKARHTRKGGVKP